MLRKSGFLAAMALLLAGSALAGTFGKVVSIGGEASDVALDEPRGVLYIANFTANRIEVMSLATQTVQTSINVTAQPSSISISPDGHWLLVAHFGNIAAPGSPANGLTLIDLRNNYAKQTFLLPDPPLGLAFGFDNRALVVTTKNFLIFDPGAGSTLVISTLSAQAAKTIPQPAQSFPPNIVAASVGASADGKWIYGFGDTLIFRYNVLSGALISRLYVSTPALGPRAISVSQDGSYAAVGWIMTDRFGRNSSQFPSPLGTLNIGGHAIDSVLGLIYSEVPQKLTDPPVLTVRDADNLTLRESLQLPEHLSGRAVLSADRSIMYASSDSGALILPVGNLNLSPRLSASVEDLVFRGNFCDRNLATQTFVVSDPGGNHVPFSITSSSTAVSVSPSSGTTPAVITVRVDPNAFINTKGTVAVQLSLSSSTAVNLPNSVRVLINSREPNQRGTIINVPGKLVDMIPNPVKDEFYVLRQDRNQVLVFNGRNNTLKATLRTCTTPMSMAVTYDRTKLLVGCDNSHLISVFDLDSLQALDPVYAPSSYAQSIASSAKATLALMRDGTGDPPQVHSIDLNTLTTSKYDRLGVYENKLPLNTVLAPAPDGSSILMASSDGSVMLYDATVDSFTVSRKDFPSLGGPYAASSYGTYVVGNKILDSSLVQTSTIQPAAGLPSGFLFVDQNGLFISAPDSSSPGVLERVNTANGTGIVPTGVVEASLLGGPSAAFTRTLLMLPSGSEFVALTTSGITVLPPQYDAAVAAPFISSAVSSADLKSAVAAGGLMTVLGSNLSGTNQATNELPLPTVINDSCLTENGAPVPMLFVSPGQVNAQMPAQAGGSVSLVMHTPGGVSNTFLLNVSSTAPSVFSIPAPGDSAIVPAVVRYFNGLLVTSTNPVHRGDILTIYLTGLGAVSPAVADGSPAPITPLSETLTKPSVQLGGLDLPVLFSGLVPGYVGLYVLNVSVPSSTPQGLSVPLTISESGFSYSQNVRVVQQQ
jgi:uncharacterized protein (TIGR03437 family)